MENHNLTDEITPEMIEAGASVLANDWGVIGAHAASELAEVIFRAMMTAAPSSGRVLHLTPPRRVQPA